ncbi:MAG: TfoX C-terminal domain [Planctomycetota bacterium]|jgi:hypothetical protein
MDGWESIGPATRRWLADLGIHAPADLADRDPVAVGLAARALGHPWSLNGVYAVAGCRLGCRWDRLPPDLRADLARRWRSALSGAS